MAHIVIAPAVQVIVGSRAHFIEQNGVLPEGVNQETLDRLVDEGLIVDVDELAAAVAEAAEAEAAEAEAAAQAQAEAETKAKADAEAKAKADAAKKS